MLNFSIELDYECFDPDLSTCIACNEVIMGKTWKLKKVINDEEPTYSPKYIYCESCYGLIDEK